MEWISGWAAAPGLSAAIANAPESPKAGAAQEDREDIAASLGGDEAAYARLVRRYQTEVSRQLWRYTRDPGQLEELVQEVFVEAYLGLRNYRGDAPFLHWLRRIATRTGYRLWRRQAVARAREAAFEGWHDAGGAPEPGVAAEAAAQVHALLALLPPRDRLVLTLQYLEELDTAEIAERTGWSRTMVKVQAFRARAKLKALMERQDVYQERGTG